MTTTTDTTATHTTTAWQQARQVTDDARFFIASANDRAKRAQHLIGTAYKMRAHITLGYHPTVDSDGKRHTAWENYCIAEFNATREVVIPIDLRQQIVLHLTEEFGMSTRDIQFSLGLKSDKTVRDDLSNVRNPVPVPVVPKPSGSPENNVKPPSRTDLVRAALIASGRDGMTIAEVIHYFRKQRWGHQHVSPILHRLHRSHFAAMLDEQRLDQHVYVVDTPAATDGRPTLQGRARKAPQEATA